jgi:mRNA interferase MazF
VLIAPVTSRPRALPTRIAFKSKAGAKNYMALDQIRAVDKSRLTKKISALDEKAAQEACERLQELFAY